MNTDEHGWKKEKKNRLRSFLLPSVFIRVHLWLIFRRLKGASQAIESFDNTARLLPLLDRLPGVGCVSPVGPLR
jgi:hypothetical protein